MAGDSERWWYDGCKQQEESNGAVKRVAVDGCREMGKVRYGGRRHLPGHNEPGWVEETSATITSIHVDHGLVIARIIK